MITEQVVDGVLAYLSSNQWRSVVQAVQERDLNHMHVYADISIYPQSFARVVSGYFARRGWSFYRDIDFIRYKPGRVALYGVHLADKINFEIYCRLVLDGIVVPTTPDAGERGANIRLWTIGEIERHIDQFAWRSASSAEEAEVRSFFRSGQHWQRAIDHILDPDVVHMHCNVETSVHPGVLRQYALADLANRGWRIEHSIHSVFNAAGVDSGKIIFLGLEPARTFDIAWYHNPDALLETNTRDTGMEGDRGTGKEFYVLRKSMVEQELREHDLVTLSEDEIEVIIERSADFDVRSAFSWRFIPY
jgi:hypothetical protein